MSDHIYNEVRRTYRRVKELPSRKFWDVSAGTPQTAPVRANSTKNCFSAAVGGKFYVLKGYTTVDTGVGEVYDPLTNLWTSVATDSIGQSTGSVAVNGNEVYCVNGDSSTAAAVTVYNVQTNTWSSKAIMPGGQKQNPACGFAGNGKLYVTAGGSGSTPYAETYEYTPGTNTWVSGKAAYPKAVRVPGHFVHGGYLYVAGGAPSSGSYTLCHKYDHVTNSWVQIAEAPDGYAFARATVVDNKAWFFYNNNRIAVYDAVANSWETKKGPNDGYLTQVFFDGSKFLVTGALNAAPQAVVVYDPNFSIGEVMLTIPGVVFFKCKNTIGSDGTFSMDDDFTGALTVSANTEIGPVVNLRLRKDWKMSFTSPISVKLVSY